MVRNNRNSKIVVLAAVISTLALTLTACGSSTDNADSTTTASDAPAEEEVVDGEHRDFNFEVGRLSKNIQDLRNDASQRIAEEVSKVNSALKSGCQYSRGRSRQLPYSNW